MKISIAMAAYNGADYIREQLNSFASQTQLPDEVIVCDDLSGDATLEVLEKFACTSPFKMVVVSNNKNLGYTRNFEKALSLCSGDLIFLSDQDDVWDENKISKILAIKRKHPNIDLIINDAMYSDENLKSAGVTVLEKVLNFSGRKNDHIAGASTAITKEFRNFVLPFPENNCPAHDVYLHRWANLLENKLVVQDVLQKWRIHGKNNSVSEMNDPIAVSNLKLYEKYRNVNSSSAYINKASEFRKMDLVVISRKEALTRLSPGVKIDRLRMKINKIIEANTSRSELSNANWFRRMPLIFLMIIKGQYKYFQGLRSVAKDIFR